MGVSLLCQQTIAKFNHLEEYIKSVDISVLIDAHKKENALAIEFAEEDTRQKGSFLTTISHFMIYNV